MDDIQSFVAKIQANIRGFERGIKKAQASANAMPDEIETDVKANINEFRRGLLQAEALAKAFSANDIEKKVKVDGSGFRNLYHSFKTNFTDPFNRRMGELAENIRTFGVIAGNMIKGALVSAFSALVPIIAGVTSAIMAAGNAIGVLVGMIGGFVGALAIAGAGVAAYGGLVASVLARYNDEAFEATDASNQFTKSLNRIKAEWNSIVDGHMDEIFLQMADAIDIANHALVEMHPFLDGVEASMGNVIDRIGEFVTESNTMETFFDNMNTKGVKVFDNLLNGVVSFGEGMVSVLNAAMPLIEWVAQGFNNLGTQFANWASRMAEQNGFHDFINYVKETLPLVGQIFGDFFLGVINLFAAFGENSQTVLQGLADMMARFKEWSSTIKESDGFQQFINYIQQNGPTVISLIGNIIMTIVNFAIAIAPLAQKVLELVDAFFQWTSELMKTNPVVGLIIGILTTLSGVLMMLAPSIVAVTTLLGPLVSWFIKLFTNGALLNGIMTVLRGSIAFLAGPVGVVIGVLMVLSSVFITLYKNVEWFRNMVNTAWTFITNFIMQQVATILSWFATFRDQGNSIFMSAMKAIAATIMQGLLTAATHFINWIANILSSIATFFNNLTLLVHTGLITFVASIGVGLAHAIARFNQFIMNVMVAIASWIVNLVTTVVNGIARFAVSITAGLANAYNRFTAWIAQTLASIAGFVVSLVSSIVSGMAQFVASIATGVMNAYSRISTFVSNAISAIVRFVSNLVSNIISGMARFVSSIASGVSNAYSRISSFVSNAISAIGRFVSNMVSRIISGMAQFVSSISSGAASALSSISSFVSNAISSIVRFVSQMVSNIASGMANFVSAIVSGGASAVSAVVSMGSRIVSSVRGFIGSMVSAGVDLIGGLVNGIRSAAGRAVSAAKSVVSNAIGAAKNLLGINSPSRVFRDIGQYTSQGLAIGISRDADRAVSEVTRMAQDITDAYRPEFNSINADVDKDINGINGRIRNTVDADITSGIETQRPIVNVTVRNEGDVEMIRSAIHTEDGIEDSLAF